MNWNLMEEINRIRKKLKAMQSKVTDMETLIYVKLTKTHSPREAQKLLQKALLPEEDVQEEWEVKMENAVTKVVLMREEMDTLVERMKNLEYALNLESAPMKKRKMRFEV